MCFILALLMKRDGMNNLMLGVICRAIFVARDNEGAVSRSLIAYQKGSTGDDFTHTQQRNGECKILFHKGSH
ncbi:hypothetical protein SEENP079_07510 [Salmonella enterica subsp. enterica serovar Newport str. RI_10P079]|nr:hypothetical protein SEENP079_07510 [Salmonella enterica subsp. enterica serovar Newport str. RI_10P079]